MNWKDTAELLGIAAIVASLVFVGLQMKQTHEIAISASFQSRAETLAGISMSRTQSPELLSAITKFGIKNNPPELTGVEEEAFCAWIESFTWMIENSLVQYRAGFLPESHWLRVREMIKALVRADGIEEMCAPFEYMTVEFVTEVEKIRQELSEESGSQ